MSAAPSSDDVNYRVWATTVTDTGIAVTPSLSAGAMEGEEDYEYEYVYEEYEVEEDGEEHGKEGVADGAHVTVTVADPCEPAEAVMAPAPAKDGEESDDDGKRAEDEEETVMVVTSCMAALPMTILGLFCTLFRLSAGSTALVQLAFILPSPFIMRYRLRMTFFGIAIAIATFGVFMAVTTIFSYYFAQGDLTTGWLIAVCCTLCAPCVNRMAAQLLAEACCSRLWDE
eukprot:PLAT13918.1.p1 GENE.PLAT13918.1~~PLAT13918.1.p1  ORF type:complete len:235 (-),score=0.92 PLAT13918.1:91-774(-)